ncbi:MAG TPA: cob(I)yrinic acid a,c-diamide adenosyltransferase [Candidatus Thermoplasmatota archaeon]|nr:cob(I)yrinic acid a,c-diamide adenosyltransferase [Candidatus Thermoplasmatota archaeon]
MAQADEAAKKAFREPSLGLSKIYTRTGDKGDTSLVGGQRVPKDDLRIEAYGTVDELNSFVGLARAAALDSQGKADAMAAALLRVQHQLFNLGSVLSTLPQDLGARQPRPTDADIAWLESEMDARTSKLPALRSFVLPGGSRLNGLLHIARTVCRRAERIAVRLRREGGCGDIEVRYLNRLSDALFAWSRSASHDLGQPETLWEPNKA